MKPLRSSFENLTGRRIDTVYQPGSAEIAVRGDAAAKHVPLPGAVYDPDEMGMLQRRLPLTTNYTVTLYCADLDVPSGNRTLTAEKVQVVGVEQVQVPAGAYECFKVEVRTNLTCWYSTDAHRYLIKWIFKESGATAELAAVNHRRPGETLAYQDPVFSFSLTAPSGWNFDRYLGKDAAAGLTNAPKSGDLTEAQAQALGAFRDNPKSEVVLYLLDPELNCHCEVNVGRVEDLDGNAKKSPRAWAEADIARMLRSGKVLANFQVRADSWQELALAGHPAVSAIGELNEGDLKIAIYSAWIFDDTNTVKFCLATSTQGFETMRPIFEGIVRSYTHSR
jgi:hypothetical protein